MSLLTRCCYYNILRSACFFAVCLLSQSATARQGETKSITGKITGENGEPIPGVTIVVKGTATGTTNNPDGTYKISVNTNAKTLVYSSIGFIGQEMAVGAQTTINVVLQTDTRQMDEVVVVGYGSQKKSDLTGAIASVSGKDIEKATINTPDKALQGKVAGVQVHTNSNAPGGSIAVQIRGTASLSAGGSPLYVIDGMPINNDFRTGFSSDAGTYGAPPNPMNSIDPSDIASIQVLKDASATAIYGSRAANGVVLITTKRGKANEHNIDLEYSLGIQESRRTLSFMNASQWAQQANERAVLLGRPKVYTDAQVDAFGEGTNWQQEVLRRAPKQNYKLSFSGGSEKIRYMLAGSLADQQGILKGSSFKRYGATINIDANVSKRLTIGESFMYTVTDNYTVPTDTKGYEGVSNVIDAVYEAPPTIPARDENGQPSLFSGYPLGGGLENPLVMTERYKQVGTTMRMIGNVYGNYKIMEGLDLDVRFGADIRDWRYSEYYPIGSEASAGANGKARQTSIRNVNYTSSNTLTYSRNIGKVHNIKVLAGFTYQRAKDESLDAAAFGFPSDIFEYYNLGLGGSPQAPGSFTSQWTLISYLGRLNYSLYNKYLLTASVRVDGDSKFGANNKYGVFPSVALAWQLDNEEFIKQMDLFSQLKLRASFGKTGNESIGVYRSLSLLATASGSRSAYIFKDAKVPIAWPQNIANPDLSWEKTSEWNIGIDMGILKDRLSFSMDYYYKKTTALLLDVPLPSQTGFESILRNTGAMLNKGFELAVNSVNMTGRFNWSTNFNIAFNRNEVLSLGGVPYLYTGWVGGGNVTPHGKNTSRLEPGHPVGQFYGSVYEGIWRSQEEIDKVGTMPAAKPGDIRYKDVNGDGIYDTENDDVYLGNPNPDFIFGLTNDLSYKRFSLHVFAYGEYGNKVLNLATQQLVLDGIGVSAARLQRWTPENPDNPYPAASASNPQRISSNMIEEGSFLRIQNISLSYNLPVQNWRTGFLRNARLGIAVDNLAVLTNYSGYDPEVNSFGSSNTVKGMDRFGYPAARVYRLEVKLGF